MKALAKERGLRLNLRANDWLSEVGRLLFPPFLGGEEGSFLPHLVFFAAVWTFCILWVFCWLDLALLLFFSKETQRPTAVDVGGQPMELDGSEGIQLPPPRSSVSSSLATHLDEESMWQMSLRMGGNIDSGPYPERPGEPDCAYYLRTGLCRFGITCKFNHPANRKLYYLRTGLCNFGPTCKFHHPKDKAGIIGRVQVNILGFPLRPNEKECAYYLRTGLCKFGLTCKFHHPQPSNATLSLRGSPIYHAVHPQPSNATPGGQSLTGALTNWSLSKPSFINSRWHGPSNYATQLFLPQGLVQVPSWSTFPQGQFGSASSAETQQANSGSTHFYGTSHQRETTTGSSTSFSSFRTASVPMEQYAWQRNSVFPERPGEPECQFYMKTGDCKFGAVCKFHHPAERRIPAPNCVLSPMGFPLRSNEPLCVFYSRYGTCKFGANCKFDHPMPSPTGSFAYNRFTSSCDAPVVRGPSGPSLGPRAITFSSDGSAETGHGKSRRLSPSDSQQMGSSDENDG